LNGEENKGNGQENNSGAGNQPEQKANQFEQVIAEKDTEIAVLRKSEGELKEKLSAVSKALSDAVAGYKDRVLELNPEIESELIGGDTVEAVNTSLQKAVNLVGRVKKSMEKEISNIRVPAWAPGRRATDLSGLSPREKIQYAIGGKK
jgi:gas vesicle protein